MNTEFVPILIAFLGGALLAGIAVWVFLSRRMQSQRLAEIEELATAKAEAEANQERRSELERDLEIERTRAQKLDRQIAGAEEQLRSAEHLFQEQREFLERGRRELSDAFKALAQEALASSSQQFLNLAEQRLETTRTEAAADLEKRKQAIETLLTPLNQELKKLEKRTGEIEASRVDAYSRLEQQLQGLSQVTSTLQERTHSLDSALRGSGVQGRWGELALRNVAELAGMSEHADFHEQLTLEDGRRPDMTVNLPGGRKIAVDAKAPLNAYLEAAEADDPGIQKQARKRHAKALREHVKVLAAREYAASLNVDLDLVILFLPGEPMLAAAYREDPDLQTDAMRSKVLIATPATLVALLRTVAIYWQQKSLADNAEQIAATARELYSRAAKFSSDLDDLGQGLRTAFAAYNRAVGSFEHRLMPMKRRLEEMKVAEQSSRQLEAPRALEEPPRELTPAVRRSDA